MDLLWITTEILNFSINESERFELILESNVEIEIIRSLYRNVWRERRWTRLRRRRCETESSQSIAKRSDQ